MAYIIAEPCVGTCDTACVEVCPVDCIHGPFNKTGSGAEVHEPGFDPTGLQLYIDPEECIDCGACEPECPVEAIFEESEVPEEWHEYIRKNYEFFERDYDG
jgi:ferredoxin